MATEPMEKRSQSLIGEDHCYTSKLDLTLFPSSEVVGRPLAALLSNDGARVFSVDIDSVQVGESPSNILADRRLIRIQGVYETSSSHRHKP